METRPSSVPAAQLPQKLGCVWFHTVGDVSTQPKLHHALSEAALFISGFTRSQTRFNLLFLSHFTVLLFKVMLVDRETLKRMNPEQQKGSLQKSEAKAKEKVSYSLYLVKPQCTQISERLFLKWQVV